MSDITLKTEYDERPVGVFDSGFGGASTLRNMLIELPYERFVYFGDNKNAPYGDRRRYLRFPKRRRNIWCTRA